MDKSYRLDLNTTEMCRACLAKNCGLNNLFRNEIVDGEILSMPVVYSIGTGLTINEKDGLPGKVCGNCETKIIDSYIFKQKCKKSLDLLKKILNIPDTDDQQKKNIEFKTIDTQTEATSQNDAVVQTDVLETECIDSTCYDIDYMPESEELFQIDEESVKIKKENSPAEVNELSSDEMFFEHYEIERVDEKDGSTTPETLIEPMQPAKKRRRSATEKRRPNTSKSTETMFECKICCKRMESTTFEMHMQEHLDVMTIVLREKPFYRCSCCHLLFLTKDELLCHFENDRLCKKSLKQQPAYSVVESEAFSESISSQIDHVQLFSCYRVVDDFFACELCDVACETMEIFETHFSAEHLEPVQVLDEMFAKTVNAKHYCSMCKKGFKNLRFAVYHMFFHQEVFQCPFQDCFNFYMKFGFLHRHVAIEHIMKSRGTTLRCSHCDFETDIFGDLKTHKKECSGRKFQCSYCDKAFFLMYTMKIHERTHTNDTRFMCRVCNKQFLQSNDLRNHLRIHSGERPYGCDICGKNFKTQGHRSDHMATHSKENTFQCSTCGNKFKSARILRGHQRVHQEKNFACELCDKRFSRPYHLKVHMKTHR